MPVALDITPHYDMFDAKLTIAPGPRLRRLIEENDKLRQDLVAAEAERDLLHQELAHTPAGSECELAATDSRAATKKLQRDRDELFDRVSRLCDSLHRERKESEHLKRKIGQFHAAAQPVADALRPLLEAMKHNRELSHQCAAHWWHAGGQVAVSLPLSVAGRLVELIDGRDA